VTKIFLPTSVVVEMRIEFAILWSNMKLVFLPTTVTYPFQLALTNVIHGLDRMIPQSAPGRQLVLKHHCMLLPCDAACVQACILYAQRHKLTHKHITSSSPSIMAMCIHVFKLACGHTSLLQEHQQT